MVIICAYALKPQILWEICTEDSQSLFYLHYSAGGFRTPICFFMTVKKFTSCFHWFKSHSLYPHLINIHSFSTGLAHMASDVECSLTPSKKGGEYSSVYLSQCSRYSEHESTCTIIPLMCMFLH